MSRAQRILNIILVVGAVGWLVKLALIVANGGENTDEGIVAVFFGIGMLGLLLGSNSLGLWLARRRSVPIRIAAAIAAIAVFWITFGLVDEALQGAIGDTDPSYIQDEAGILVAAVAWLAIGIWLLRRTAPVASEIEPADD